MGNKIVVYRAPRFKIVQWGTLDEGTFFVGQDGQIMVRAHGTSNQNVDCSKRGIEEFWPERGFVHPFESFEAMCKWVSNGRRLEDLKGDASSEWISPLNMKMDSVAEVVAPEDWKGRLLLRIETGWIPLRSTIPMCSSSELIKLNPMDGFLVWPLGAGDTITITAQP